MKGIKTYLAAGAGLLSAIFEGAGYLPPGSGTGGLIAMAIIFLRMALADHAANLAKLGQETAEAKSLISDINATIASKTAPPSPATIPFTGSPQS